MWVKALYATGTTRVTLDGKASAVHGLRYTIVDGKVIDPQAMLREVGDMVQRAKRAASEGTGAGR
jgi:hypothetical protein